MIYPQSNDDTRLFSKDRSIRCFLENSCSLVPTDLLKRETIIEKTGWESRHQRTERLKEKNFIPKNIIELAHDIFSKDNVFVSRYPSEYIFNKKGEFVLEASTSTFRSHNPYEILDTIDKYLKKGSLVYVYTYYGIKNDTPTAHGLINSYWWRMITKIGKDL